MAVHRRCRELLDAGREGVDRSLRADFDRLGRKRGSEQRVSESERDPERERERTAAPDGS
jgi:hypothetical protein